MISVRSELPSARVAQLDLSLPPLALRKVLFARNTKHSLTVGSIFTTVLITRTTKNIGTMMPAALATTNIDASTMTQLITAISTNPSGDFTIIPGVTSDMARIGLRAYQDASASAFGTVFLSTIAFSAISAILAIWSPNVNHKLTQELTTPIHDRSTKAAVTRNETVEQKV